MPSRSSPASEHAMSERMRAGSMRRRGATRLGCLLSVLLIATVAYFGIGAMKIYWRSVEFKDAMHSELLRRTKLPDRELKARYRFIADSLGLPESAGDVVIKRKNGVITVESWYEETLVLPGHQRPWAFNPVVSGNY